MSVFNSIDKTFLCSCFFSKLFLCHWTKFSFFFNYFTNCERLRFEFKFSSCFWTNFAITIFKMFIKCCYRFNICFFCFSLLFYFLVLKYSSLIFKAFSISFCGVFWVFFWNSLNKTTIFPSSKQQNILKILLWNSTLIS